MGKITKGCRDIRQGPTKKKNLGGYTRWAGIKHREEEKFRSRTGEVPDVMINTLDCVHFSCVKTFVSKKQ